jgi:hypothetical protein
MSFSDDDDEILDIKSPIYNTDRIFSADEVPLGDMCFEIGNEEESETQICLKKLEEVSRLDKPISPIPYCKEYDGIKSPLNTFSDCGYSSHGSPFSVHDHEFGVNDINESFNFLEPCLELFPSLA